MSGDHTPVNLWGPGLWAFLHVASFEYPEVASDSDAVAQHTFLWAAAVVLPCSRCRAHFTASLTAQVPFADSPVLSGREALAGYLVDLHNDINRRTGKPEWTLEQARAHYAGGGSVCPIAAPCPAWVATASPPESSGRRRCGAAGREAGCAAAVPAAAVGSVMAGVAALLLLAVLLLGWRRLRRDRHGVLVRTPPA